MLERRREFLQQSVKAIAAITLLPLAACGQNRKEDTKVKLPEDTISEKELSRANIRIFQSPAVQLYLTESAFEIPLFRDAKAGEIKKVNIVLVDAENLEESNVFEKTPKEAQGHFRIFRKRVENEVQILQKLIAFFENTLNELRQNKKPGSENLIIDFEKQTRDLQDRIQAINAPLGIFIDGREYKRFKPELLQNEPEELAETITIYVAVGGRFKPKTDQSYPSRKQFPDRDDNQNQFVPKLPDDYRVKEEYVTAGFILHHEVSHYEIASGSFAEYQTDTRTLERIDRASQSFQETQRLNYLSPASANRVSTSYPFIFVTDEGIIVTKINTRDDDSNHAEQYDSQRNHHV